MKENKKLPFVSMLTMMMEISENNPDTTIDLDESR